jgi:hypothetical protein
MSVAAGHDPDDSYHAQLFGSAGDVRHQQPLVCRVRLTTVLVGKGGARQYAYGVEVGYVVVDNVWVTLGYNLRGFRDDELTGSDYTNRGWVLGMRYKFDEDLFKSKGDASVNKTLTPEGHYSKVELSNNFKLQTWAPFDAFGVILM